MSTFFGHGQVDLIKIDELMGISNICRGHLGSTKASRPSQTDLNFNHPTEFLVFLFPPPPGLSSFPVLLLVGWSYSSRLCCECHESVS